MSLTSLTAVELGAKIRRGEVSAEEAVRDFIAQIHKKEPDIHSFVTVDEEGAVKQAGDVQKKISAGELTGALAGVPVAVKDNMCTKGLLTTCSSRMLALSAATHQASLVLLPLIAGRSTAYRSGIRW